MREQIGELAKVNGRSMNSEIVARLQESLQGTDAKSLTTGVLIDELVSRLGARIQIVVAPEVAAQAGIKSGE